MKPKNIIVGEKEQFHSVIPKKLHAELKEKGIADQEVVHAGALLLLGRNREFNLVRKNERDRNSTQQRFLKDLSTLRSQIGILNEAFRREFHGQNPLLEYANARKGP